LRGPKPGARDTPAELYEASFTRKNEKAAADSPVRMMTDPAIFGAVSRKA
jgi:hypothetical protein